MSWSLDSIPSTNEDGNPFPIDCERVRVAMSASRIFQRPTSKIWLKCREARAERLDERLEYS